MPAGWRHARMMSASLFDSGAAVLGEAMSKFKHKCPEHGEALSPKWTKYGARWECQVAGCTVCCWDGWTSTPANEETRKIRMECHKRFDQTYKGDFRRFQSRSLAYRWLAAEMKIPKSKAHIGMFDKDQCLQLLKLLEGLA